ncbi:MAG: hypothetical protein AB7F98_05245 [Novosphingobium sp.]
MSLFLALLAQVGPFVTTPAPAPDRPAAQRKHGQQEAKPAQPESPKPSRLQACLDLAASDPGEAVEQAEDWRDQSKGSAQVDAQRCLGAAHSARGEWSEAESAFLAGRDAAAANDRLLRAQLGGMAGNAALAAGGAERALAALDAAHADATSAENIKLAGEVALDRARALVALDRNEDAARALVEARTSTPDNPLAWLLSATLSRRMDRLGEAQAQIATAAQLDPRDPEIGLEAGLIAVLSGHDEAARKSWQSVVAMAPDGEAGARAKAYLVQLDAPANPPPPAPRRP